MTTTKRGFEALAAPLLPYGGAFAARGRRFCPRGRRSSGHFELLPLPEGGAFAATVRISSGHFELLPYAAHVFLF